jgi:hypothetical protein
MPRVAAVRIRLAVHRRTDLPLAAKWPRQSSSKIVPGSEFAPEMRSDLVRNHVGRDGVSQEKRQLETEDA